MYSGVALPSKTSSTSPRFAIRLRTDLPFRLIVPIRVVVRLPGLAGVMRIMSLLPNSKNSALPSNWPFSGSNFESPPRGLDLSIPSLRMEPLSRLVANP